MRCLVAVALVGAFIQAGLAAEKTAKLVVPIPAKPATVTADTTFLVGFDAEHNPVNDADYSLGNGVADGLARVKRVKGRFGNGVSLIQEPVRVLRSSSSPKRMDSLDWTGSGNANAHHGTLQFWVKTLPDRNIWNDGKQHPLVMLRTEPSEKRPHRKYQMGLFKTADNALALGMGRWRADPLFTDASALRIPVAKIAPDRWHFVTISWDSLKSVWWLSIDNTCVTGASPLAAWRKGRRPVGNPQFEYMRLGPCTRGNPGLGAGVVIDDVAIYDETLPVLLAKKPRDVRKKLARRARAAAERCLRILAGLKRGGLWASHYQWPSLQPIWTTRMPLLVAHGAGSIRNATYCLNAYEALGDSAFLDIARSVGDLMVEHQAEEGPIPNRFFINKDEKVTAPQKPTYVAFNDAPYIIRLRFLLYLHRVTKDDKYLAAVQKGCQLIMKAQSPYGGWPDGYHVTKKRDANSECSWEDGSFSSTFRFMLMMYHYTKKQAYLDCAAKAAKWPLVTQVKDGPCAGAWAAVYDKDNKPSDGEHHFAPFACGVGTTRGAARTCLRLYQLNGDRAYLDAAEKAITFIERSFRQHEKAVPKKWQDTLFRFYELKTGRPVSRVFDKQRRGRAINLHWTRYKKNPDRYVRYYLDTAEGRAGAAKHEKLTVEGLMNWSWYRGWSCSRKQLAGLKARLKQARATKPRRRGQPRPPTVASYKARMMPSANPRALTNRALSALSKIRSPGVWAAYAAEGASGDTVRWHGLRYLLQYVLASRAVDGEITPGQADMFGRWCPARNLYDTPLLKE